MNDRFSLVFSVLVTVLTSSLDAEVIIEKPPSTSGGAYSGHPGGQQVATPFFLAGFAQVDSIDWYSVGPGSGGDFRLTIFQDSSGIPGPTVFTTEVTVPTAIGIGLVYDGRYPILKHSTRVSTGLVPGRYWLSVTSFMPTSGQFLWERSSATASGNFAYRNGDSGSWSSPGSPEEFAFTLHSLAPVQTNVTVSLCCETVTVETNGSFRTDVVAYGTTNLVAVNARILDSAGATLADVPVQLTDFNGSFRSGVISYAHSNLVAGGSVRLTHIVSGPAGAVLALRTNIVLRVPEPPVVVGLCCSEAFVEANGFVTISLQTDRASPTAIRVAAEVRLPDGELLGTPWGSISNGIGSIFFAHPRLTNGAILRLTNVVDNAFGRLGGITTARLVKPPRPVVSFSRAGRVIEPYGSVPIEVYIVGNAQAGLPETPIRVVVRQTSGERRDQLGNRLSLESRDLYFSPWQAVQEVSFGDLATDATFVLETTAADIGEHPTFAARLGEPAFSVPDYISGRPAERIKIQVWRMDRQDTAETVRFRTENGSARAGIDYVPMNGELVFSGEQLKEFEAEVLPGATPATSFNIRFENPELFFVNRGLTRIEISRLISFGASKYWLDAKNRLHFTLELNAAADFPVTASIAVPEQPGGGPSRGFIFGGGCGGHGEFCGRILGTFTIPAGETNAMFTLDLSAAEWFSTVLIYNTEIMVGERSQAQVLPAGWTDDSRLVDVYSSESTEGHATTFTVSRADTLTNALKLSYSTIDGTATAGQDYEATHGEVTLPAGSSAEIKVQTLADNLVEEIESFGLIVNGTSSKIYVRGGTNALISEATPLPFHLSLRSNPAEGQPALEFMINAPGNDPISFRYFTSDISARAGIDYEPRSASVTNKFSEIVSIPLPDNPFAEAGKEFLFTVIAEGATPFTKSMRIAIQDNEIPDQGEPLLAPEVFYDYEGSTPARELLVQRTGDTSQPLTVQARTRDKTAREGEDYVSLDVKIEFAPLEVSKTISVRFLDDKVSEPQEEFVLELAIQAPDGKDSFKRETLFYIPDNDPVSGMRLRRSPAGILFLEGIYPNSSFKTRKIEASEDMLTWNMVTQYRIPQFIDTIQMAIPDESHYRFYRARLE